MDHPLTIEGNRILDYLADHYPVIREDRHKLESTLIYKENHDGDRCWALVKQGRCRCTRKRQNGQMFCGNHLRSRPYGCLDGHSNQIPTWCDPKFGDDYLIDADGNVYNNVDIPVKIGKIIDDSIELDRVVENEPKTEE